MGCSPRGHRESDTPEAIQHARVVIGAFLSHINNMNAFAMSSVRLRPHSMHMLLRVESSLGGRSWYFPHLAISAKALP